jgi:hypothetical protein
MKLKLLILATAMLGATAIIPASAGYSCQWLGRFYVCNDTGGGGQTSCQWLGRFWTCN